MTLKFVLAVCILAIIDLSMVSSEEDDGKWCDWEAACFMKGQKDVGGKPIEPCKVTTLMSKLKWEKNKERKCGGGQGKVQYQCCLSCYVTTCFSLFARFFNFRQTTKTTELASGNNIRWHKRYSTRKGCGFGIKYVMCPETVVPTPQESMTEIIKTNSIEFK